MRPTLILQPIHNSSADILQCLALSKPLSSEQRNFLEWHRLQLSSADFDPVLKYYLDASKKSQNKFHSSFLLPHEILNYDDIQNLKKRLLLFLQNKSNRIVMGLSQQQFLQFTELNIQELIFWHGNQYLTGAPFIPGGIPPVIYFQWGNLFGIVKYVVLSGEKNLKANILIYFEDMQDRNINQCVEDYNKQLKDELNHQNEVLLENKIDTQNFNQFLIKTPTLKLQPHFV